MYKIRIFSFFESFRIRHITYIHRMCQWKSRSAKQMRQIMQLLPWGTYFAIEMCIFTATRIIGPPQNKWKITWTHVKAYKWMFVEQVQNNCFNSSRTNWWATRDFFFSSSSHLTAGKDRRWSSRYGRGVSTWSSWTRFLSPPINFPIGSPPLASIFEFSVSYFKMNSFLIVYPNRVRQVWCVQSNWSDIFQLVCISLRPTVTVKKPHWYTKREMVLCFAS